MFKPEILTSQGTGDVLRQAFTVKDVLCSKPEILTFEGTGDVLRQALTVKDVLSLNQKYEPYKELVMY